MIISESSEVAENLAPEYALEFWQISREITAFSIAQSLFFCVSVGVRKGDLYEAVIRAPRIVERGIIIATTVYLVLTVLCCIAQFTLDDFQNYPHALTVIMIVSYIIQLTLILFSGAATYYIFHQGLPSANGR